MTPLHSLAGSVATIVLAAAGLTGFGHASTPTGDAGAFGGPVQQTKLQPLYVERTRVSPAMREVRCAGPQTGARCFEATPAH
ncbi:MAG TPA: hypothetical protein VFB25_02540 [Gaiellaceae bacterium]|nr:hypothetical protein [Gaiellaceae bacterium]